MIKKKFAWLALQQKDRLLNITFLNEYIYIYNCLKSVSKPEH